MLKKILLGSLVLLAAPLCTLAAGPVDVEVGLYWWQTDFDRNSSFETISTDASAPGYQAQLWFFNKFGLRAGMFSSDLSDLNEDDADYLSADVMYRFIGLNENNFLAIGAGWEKIDFVEAGGVSQTVVETSGPRATLQGRVGLFGMVQGFAHVSYLPELDEYSDPSGEVYRDVEGLEYELGVTYDIAPFVDMKAGYRVYEFDFTKEPALAAPYSGSVKNEGFFIGVGVHF